MYENHRASTALFSGKIKCLMSFHEGLADGTSSVDCEKWPFVFQQVLIVFGRTSPVPAGLCAPVWCSGCSSDTTTPRWWKHRAESSATSSSLESSCPTPWHSSSWPNPLLPYVPCGASAWARHSLSATLPCSPKPTESPGFSMAWKTERAQWDLASLAHLLRWARGAFHPSICIAQMDGLTNRNSLTPHLRFFFVFFLFLLRPGVHLSESDLGAVSDGLSVAAAGGSRDAALYFARTATDCHPQV